MSSTTKNGKAKDTAVRPELNAAIEATAQVPVPEKKAEEAKPLTAKERLKRNMVAYAARGMAPALELDASVFAGAKFQSKVKPPKDWEEKLAGRKIGEIKVTDAIEAAALHIEECRQASCPVDSLGKNVLSVTAQKDVQFPEEVAVVLSGRFLTECLK